MMDFIWCLLGLAKSFNPIIYHTNNNMLYGFAVCKEESRMSHFLNSFNLLNFGGG